MKYLLSQNSNCGMNPSTFPLTNSIYSDGTECVAQKSYRKKDRRYDYIRTNDGVYAKLHSLFEVCVDEIPTRFAYLININLLF